MQTIETHENALIRLAGRRDGPCVMLLHAFAETGSCFDQLAACGLAKHFHLVTPDLWGFGASPARSDVATISDFATALATLIETLKLGSKLGLVAHSIASAMAVEVADRLGDRVMGIFSIEGNLTVADTTFTGRAAGFADAGDFKRSFLADIWQLGEESETFRSYYASAALADAETMWKLGRDSVIRSGANGLGEAYRGLKRPSLYYWSSKSTPQETREWIRTSGIEEQAYSDASHWPMLEQPQKTADDIGRFFASCFAG